MANVLDDRRTAQGMLYGFHLEPRVRDQQVKALMQIKDIAREAGIYLKADGYRRLEVREIEIGQEGKKLATCMFI